MNKKLRYSLIGSGFIIFLVLAPLLVFYVKGLNYDFQNGHFVQTGIIAIKADPKDAAVFLDGNKVSDSIKDLQFLEPKAYDLQLEKNGYFSWKKRLEVNEGQVTWASPASGKIFLFYSAPQTSALKSSVQDFALDVNSGNLAILSASGTSFSNLKNPSSGQILALPKKADTIASASPDVSRIVLTNSKDGGKTVSLADFNSQKIFDLSKLAQAGETWIFGPGNRLFMLSSGNFYLVDEQNSAKELLENNVIAATFGKDWYILKKNGQNSSLEISSQPGQDSQIILADLPAFSTAKIMVTFERQVYLLGDGNLYKVGQSLSPLALGVSALDFSYDYSTLAFWHAGELDYLNPFSQETDLITRRTTTLEWPILRFSLGYCFFAQNSKNIIALELDNRDRQNEYGLYSGENIKKIAASGDGQFLTVLDNNDLKILKIR